MCKLLRVTVKCKLVGKGNTILYIHTHMQRASEHRMLGMKISRWLGLPVSRHQKQIALPFEFSFCSALVDCVL